MKLKLAKKSVKKSPSPEKPKKSSIRREGFHYVPVYMPLNVYDAARSLCGKDKLYPTLTALVNFVVAKEASVEVPLARPNPHRKPKPSELKPPKALKLPKPLKLRLGAPSLLDPNHGKKLKAYTQQEKKLKLPKPPLDVDGEPMREIKKTAPKKTKPAAKKVAAKKPLFVDHVARQKSKSLQSKLTAKKREGRTEEVFPRHRRVRACRTEGARGGSSP